MKRFSLAPLTALMIAAPAFAAPLGNGFTYQGELKLSGSPVNVATDFQFSLWDGAGTGCPPTGGVQLGATQTVSSQTVTEGRFTVILNAAGEFGLTAFDGNARWLQIAVRSPAGGGAYTTLCPRQPITATPYALKVPGLDGHSLDAADGSPLDALYVDGNGNVGIGTTAPTSLLHVNGVATMNGFQMPTGAGAGKLLTSDVSGNATWQPGGGGGLTLPYDGTTSTAAPAFKVTNSGTGEGLNGSSTSAFGVGVRGAGYTGMFGTTSGVNGVGVYGTAAGGQTANSIGVVGSSESTIGYGVFGWAVNTTGANRGVYGRSDSPTGSGVHGQHGPTGNYGILGGTDYGVEGFGAGGIRSGVFGKGFLGVSGRSDDPIGVGVFGEAPASDAWAGFFNGRVHVTGAFSSGNKFFRIDHPLDPENKVLMHSCVESDEMKNVYDGVATLDGNGEAWVELPKWFESLNRDFRYQLTCIGGSALVYIAQKVQGNRFQVAGGKPGMEVSWQVTGVRQDALAKATPMRVEVDKQGSERGRYLNPAAFGLPETRGVDYERTRAARSAAMPKPQGTELVAPPKP